MSTKLFNKFWVALTAVITIGLLACLIPVAMGLAYLRGYWVSTLFEKKDKQENR
jgi:hypothetical protein